MPAQRASHNARTHLTDVSCLHEVLVIVRFVTLHHGWQVQDVDFVRLVANLQLSLPPVV
jgi:hypothetical protein